MIIFTNIFEDNGTLTVPENANLAFGPHFVANCLKSCFDKPPIVSLQVFTVRIANRWKCLILVRRYTHANKVYSISLLYFGISLTYEDVLQKSQSGEHFKISMLYIEYLFLTCASDSILILITRNIDLFYAVSNLCFPMILRRKYTELSVVISKIF